MGIRLEWNKGAPEKREIGMALLFDTGKIILIGDGSYAIAPGEIAWAWYAKPQEVEWQQSMAKAHGVGR